MAKERRGKFIILCRWCKSVMWWRRHFSVGVGAFVCLSDGSIPEMEARKWDFRVLALDLMPDYEAKTNQLFLFVESFITLGLQSQVHFRHNFITPARSMIWSWNFRNLFSHIRSNNRVDLWTIGQAVSWMDSWADVENQVSEHDVDLKFWHIGLNNFLGVI